ncbi:hypothetical protein [Rhizobium vallis]|nr:hypothetical protein [Rhizobium vallis]
MRNTRRLRARSPAHNRFGTGYVTMDQVRQHYADPGKFNGYA